MAVANRNSLIHQDDDIDRALTWFTLSVDLPAWHASLSQSFEAAAASIEQVSG